MKGLITTLVFLPFVVFADARFVEAPAECHFPYDNANVDNEFKLSSCFGVAINKNGGTAIDVQVRVSQENLNNGAFRIGGEDVWDVETYPNYLRIFTTGIDSGTNCNVVDADGNQYATANWTATTVIRRGPNFGSVNVEYWLQCWNAALQVAQ